ncbi:MAG: hypothetical protein ACFCBW_20795 [Candidatus Competibacterales bacterium]
MTEPNAPEQETITQEPKDPMGALLHYLALSAQSQQQVAAALAAIANGVNDETTAKQVKEMAENLATMAGQYNQIAAHLKKSLAS